MKNYLNETFVFFRSFFNDKKAKQLSKKLIAYNIRTVEQLCGAINPLLPYLSITAVKNKGLFSSYRKVKKGISLPNYHTNKLKRILDVSISDAKRIESKLNKIKLPKQAFKSNDSVWSVGLVQSKKIHSSSFWSVAKFNSAKDAFVLPHYERMGRVFSQGQRGTCVANACCSLTDYISNDRTSRQFLYHQCKMVDGIKNSEGTYIETAMQLLSNMKIVDFGVVQETSWKYNANTSSSKHQGPPPEKCFNSIRYFNSQIVYARSGSIVEDIKRLLLGSDKHQPTPVVIGVPLFESFQNQSSNRTGWITMPLPGERITGGHAMLIVGYSERDRLFLVRNSWGASYAYENPFKLPGHALIPYNYFTKYCTTAASLISLQKVAFNVPHNERLYHKKIIIRQSNHFRAAISKTRKRKRKPTKIVKSKRTSNRFLWALTGSAATLLIMYNKVVSELIINLIKIFEN